MRHRARSCILGCALVTVALFFSVHAARATLNNGEPAIDILGEFNSPSVDTTPDYVKSCVNNGASSLGFSEEVSDDFPNGVIDAANNRMFISDQSNNRVLVFTLNSSNQISSKTPANVLGQADFVSCSPNQGGATTQSGMNQPAGLDFDAANNRLFVADYGNNRVLVFNTSSISNGMNASYVLGQSNFANNGNATSQSGMNQPQDVRYDSANSRLFVSDYSNNRVTVWNVATGSIANGENASYELGHPSGGTAFTAGGSGKTQSTLHGPVGLAYDSADTLLYVAEYANNRVTVWNVATGTIANGENASNVLGQSSFTTNTAATTQAGMSGPQGVSYDSANNRLFVGDFFNNRTLVFSTANVISGENAVDVLGQYNSVTMADNPADYVKNCANDGASPFGFNLLGVSSAASMAIDATNHRLFVADSYNNRVLVFALTNGNVISSKTPANVLGQPDLVSCGAATTQSGMNAPGFPAFDATNNRLFVTDVLNNRVLVFNTSSISNGMNASYVLGQADFVSNGAATTQSGMNNPNGLALDSANNLYIGDYNNNRVLVFNVAPGTIANGENASNELGQPSGTAFTSNTPATTQSGMSGVEGLAYDSTNSRLFVAEANNNRVTVFNTSSISNGMNASNVLGQANFTSGGASATQSTMANPQGVAFDGTNSRLFVAEYGNNRVTVFNVATGTIANGENASYVLGQANFTSTTAATTQSGMTGPVGAAYDSTNNQVYVADSNNNRAMIFSTSSITNGENATDELGQYTSPSSTATVSYTQNGPNNGPNTLGLNSPGNIAIDSVNHRLFVADENNNRVLVYNLTTNNTLAASSGGHTAVNVLGQSSLQGANAAATTQSGMNFPTDLAYDSANNRLFVADTNNMRVLVFNTASISNGMNASYVLGQANFTSNTQTASRSGMATPAGLAYDPTNNRLFVAEEDNNRVTVWNVAPGSIANGENASNVLGQSNYTNHALAHTQAGEDFPDALALDVANQRLFVADSGNFRTLMYNVAPGTIANGENASNVLGQTNYTNHATACTQAGEGAVGGLAYDQVNARLFEGDYANSRVLVYAVGVSSIVNGENAFAVLGEANYTTCGQYQVTAQNNLSVVNYLTYDSGSQQLYVGDDGNNRVMIFSTANAGQIVNDESASYVLGQATFTTGTGATTQSGMSGPVGVFYDSTNTQEYVVDQNNNRVMIFNAAPASITNGENATDELGQYTSPSSAATVSWTQNGPNNGPTALGMYGVQGVAMDTVNHYLYVSDFANNRVMVYALNPDNSISTSSGGHMASYVLGQSSLQGGNTATITQSGLSGPVGLAVDPANNRLFVADSANNRVMVFSTASLSNGENASYELGQPSGGTAFTTNSTATTQSGMYDPEALAYDAANARLFVADNNNNRVLVFNVAPGTIANGENAAYELGQASGGTAFTSNSAATTQSGMYAPDGLAYDAANNRLFVAEYVNNRVTVLNVAPGSIANGENAAYELGQPSFTSDGSATTQAGLHEPSLISYDANNNRLFVADTANNRVTVFNVAPGSIANGENAAYELGQPSGATAFTTANAATTQSGLNNPTGVFYDPGSGRLFVADSANNRVTIFEGSFMGSSQWTPGYE